MLLEVSNQPEEPDDFAVKSGHNIRHKLAWSLHRLETPSML